MRSEFKERLIGVALVLGVLTALAACGVLGWAVVNTDTNTLRWWALLATVTLATTLPLAIFAGWRLGQRDAQERLAGIDAGVGQVMRAAHDTAALRVNVLRATQRAKETPLPVITTLPAEPEFRDPPLLQAGDVVEM